MEIGCKTPWTEKCDIGVEVLQQTSHISTLQGPGFTALRLHRSARRIASEVVQRPARYDQSPHRRRARRKKHELQRN